MKEGPQPWLASDGSDGQARRHAPATARNREPILNVLSGALPRSGLVLEIASGSGEHIIEFARAFPGLAWQPSDSDPAALRSISAWSAEDGPGNIAPPLWLDAALPEEWPVAAADAILCINMVHISPWQATLGLLRGAGRLLGRGGLLYLYGPFLRDGRPTAPSNEAFDRTLRERNENWGLRSVESLEAAALQEGMVLDQLVEMPANNLSLIFRPDPQAR